MADRREAAGADDRPECQTIRDPCVAEIRRVGGGDVPDDVPLYLTLPGNEGQDIQALVDAGLIALTETGALDNSDALRIVAVQASPEAIVGLQIRYPGLKILEEPVEELLHSTGELSWPDGEVKQFFRAQVVNFDLRAPLEASVESDQLVFPILKLVRKLAVLHAADPHVDWTLCLTLRGGIEWSGRAEAMTCKLLSENFTRSSSFSVFAQALLGVDLHEDIAVRPTQADVRGRDPSIHQRVLMALVPKKIAFDAHTLGWRVETTENLRYAGTAGTPMVTWVLRFSWDDRAQTSPEDLYSEGLAAALLQAGEICADGRVERDPQPDPLQSDSDPGSESARI